LSFEESAKPMLTFLRSHEGERILCAFNMSAQRETFPMRTYPTAKPIIQSKGAALTPTEASLPAYGVLIASL